MKKGLKIFLITLGSIIGLLLIDLLCVFIMDRPIFALKLKTPGGYSGVLYDVYKCGKDAKIVAKGTKLSCATEVVDIVDLTLTAEDFVCAEALDKFYEDMFNEYYFSCLKGAYVVVKYADGTEESVASALNKGIIKISDLDTYKIHYYKEKKFDKIN